MKRKTQTTKAGPAYPMSIETFREPGLYSLTQLKQDEPSAFNGVVSVKRYRVTVEEIPESDEVIVARIRKLWAECKNHHHWDPLQRAADRYGVKLDHKERK